MTILSGQRCIFCQSPYHTYRHCPMIYKMRGRKQASAQAGKQDYMGRAPNVFVGHYGYPNINVGMLNVEEYNDHDDPLKWSHEAFPIEKIIELRSSLVNARFGAHVKNPSGMVAPSSFGQRFLEMSQEVSLARKPADVEINLAKKPTVKMSFNNSAAPHGPSVALKNAKLASNPSTDPHLEKAASDTDWKAADAMNSLFRKGIDEHRLTRVLSIGNLGMGKRRKLVPTRWSITAVDDTLGKSLIREIKIQPEGDCSAYFGGYMGNHYLIMFFDDVWQYELFEQFVPQEKKKHEIVVEHDYEPYTGRKTYAEETAGGYYAARLGILEKLKERKRQASVLAIRIITEEYSAPLGVWVVREAVRKTLATQPMQFGDRQLMISFAKQFLQKKFGYDVSDVLGKKSNLLQNLRNQKKLKEWL